MAYLVLTKSRTVITNNQTGAVRKENPQATLPGFGPETQDKESNDNATLDSDQSLKFLAHI